MHFVAPFRVLVTILRALVKWWTEHARTINTRLDSLCSSLGVRCSDACWRDACALMEPIRRSWGLVMHRAR